MTSDEEPSPSSACHPRSPPDPGQRFAFHFYRFQVLRKQRNQITALRVEKEEKVQEGF